MNIYWRSITAMCLSLVSIEGNTTSQIGNKLSVKRAHQLRSCCWHVKLAALVMQGTTEIDNGRRRRAMKATTPGINAAFTCLSEPLQLSCIVWTVSIITVSFHMQRSWRHSSGCSNVDRNTYKRQLKPRLWLTAHCQQSGTNVDRTAVEITGQLHWSKDNKRALGSQFGRS
jgi:hypothetical protein